MADFLGLPHDSDLQRCDHLALVTLHFPATNRPISSVVDAASVPMDSRRLNNMPAPTRLNCGRALRAGVITLEWLPGDRTRNHGGDDDLATRIRLMITR